MKPLRLLLRRHHSTRTLSARVLSSASGYVHKPVSSKPLLSRDLMQIGFAFFPAWIYGATFLFSAAKTDPVALAQKAASLRFQNAERTLPPTELEAGLCTSEAVLAWRREERMWSLLCFRAFGLVRFFACDRVCLLTGYTCRSSYCSQCSYLC